jgi:hypothetical protein
VDRVGASEVLEEDTTRSSWRKQVVERYSHGPPWSAASASRWARR